MRITSIVGVLLALLSLSIPACSKHEDHAEEQQHKVIVTNPKSMDVVLSQQYVCQVHSQRNIDVRPMQGGYLEAINIKEGQAVKTGEVMFKIKPILYVAKRDTALAERDLAKLEYNNTKNLAAGGTGVRVVSQNEVALYKAKLEKAEAMLKLAEAELDFATVRAPFDGIIDRLHHQQGSLVKEADILTNLSDNSVMWVYFNVPQKQYIEYDKMSPKVKAEQKIELEVADHVKYECPGKFGKDPTTGTQYGAIEAKFNNETGTVAFRADFPNPSRMLRHGMTGNVVISRTLHNAIVIPQRATFEILAKRYVFVVQEDNTVKQREIVVQNELEDIFIIESGITVKDKIIYEGVRQVRDGDPVDYTFRAPEKILGHQKNHAE